MISYEIIKRKEFKCQNGFHPNDTLLIVLEGSFACSFGNKSLVTHKNDVFVFHAKEAFKRKILEELQCINIQFDKFPFEFESGIMPLSDPIRAESTISLLKKAISEGDDTKSIHYINDLIFLNQSLNASCCKKIGQTVSECVNYLKQNFSRTITLDALAERFYISKQWLIRKFKAEIGATPIEYLTDIRMSRAQELLKQTELPIGEIAIKCGYDNIYYFSKSFRKNAGLSPKEYRRKFQL